MSDYRCWNSTKQERKYATITDQEIMKIVSTFLNSPTNHGYPRAGYRLQLAIVVLSDVNLPWRPLDKTRRGMVSQALR